MTISSSLNAGVSGLTANASRLAAISDNIANSNTAGYKRVTTSFESMVVGSSGGRYTAGGVSVLNERQIGERGSLISTTNSTDIAVDGNGFVPVADIATVKAGGNPVMALTSTGSFTTDPQGYLTTNSGLVLMGWPANPDQTFPLVPRDTAEALEPIRFNVNQLAGEPTSRISLGVNLPATETEAGAAFAPQSMSTEYFDNLGKSAQLDITFTPVPPVAPATASNQWTMQITDSASGGDTIGHFTINFDDTVANGGNINTTVTAVTAGANPNPAGATYDAATGTLSVTTASGPMEIYIGPGPADGLTQLSDVFVAATIEKNGSSAESYAGVEIDQTGNVRVLYANGTSRIAYQVPLADMPNPNGMTTMSRQTYMPSDQSGPYYLWDAGTGPTGTIQGFTREESKTDVAGELTSMIQTQRAYSSNATVIQTVDEMLQETTSLKR